MGNNILRSGVYKGVSYQITADGDWKLVSFSCSPVIESYQHISVGMAVTRALKAIDNFLDCDITRKEGLAC